MLCRLKKFNTILYALFVLVLLLISCESSAYSVEQIKKSNQKFNNLIKSVVRLKNNNTDAALQKLKTASVYIDHLSLIDQLKFYKYQSEIYADQAHYELSKNSATHGLNLSKQLKSPSILIAELTYDRGFALESLGYLKSASENYRNGLDIATSLNNQNFIAQGLINLGAIYYQTNRYQLSLTVLNKALIIANKLNDEDLKGYINAELGNLYGYIGETESSIKFYRTAYTHYRNIGKSQYALNALANIAVSYQDKKRYNKSIKIYKEILKSLNKTDDHQFYYNIYIRLSWNFLRKKPSDPETAYQYLLIAQQYLPEVEQHGAVLSFLINKSFILEGLHQYDKALNSLRDAEKSLTTKQKQANDFNYLSILKLRAKIYRTLGHYETSYDILSDYVARYLKRLKNNQSDAIQDMRLRYESEQKELFKQALEKKGVSQAIYLHKVEINKRNQQVYFLFFLTIFIVITWLLVRLIRGQRHLLKISQTDALTGLINRRRFLQLGERLLKTAKSNSLPFSLLMIDIDHFKQINDNYGHHKGDIVIQTLAEIGTDMLRKQDVFARFGGEEFIVLLPNKDKNQATVVAERLRLAFIDSTIKLSMNEPVTLCVGVASLDDNRSQNLVGLIKNADNSLYKAKTAGRNRVCS